MLQLSELRVRLDQMTDRIVSRLKDRSRFPLNEAVYRPDAVSIRGKSGISFLQHALEGLEAYHQSLGRYDYPDQFPIFSGQIPTAPVTRTIGKPSLPRLAISTRDDLLAFYQRLLPRLCPSGDDPDAYGETVYVDSDLLELIHERINVGRYVAQVKATQDPTIFAVVGDPAQLDARLRDASRENALVNAAKTAAQRYELDPQVTEDVFRWIVDETMLVERAYLRQLAAEIISQRLYPTERNRLESSKPDAILGG
jgi:chorismate mutase